MDGIRQKFSFTQHLATLAFVTKTVYSIDDGMFPILLGYFPNIPAERHRTFSCVNFFHCLILNSGPQETLCHIHITCSSLEITTQSPTVIHK